MPQRWKVHEPLRPHFVTCTVIHLLPVFRRDEYFQVLISSLRHCISNRGLRIYAFVIMPDHFHLICSHEGGDISGVIRDLKRFTARALYEMLARDHAYAPWLNAMRRAARGNAEAKLWDDEFHPEQVHSEGFFRQKCDYIHANPVKAGYVEEPCEWKYSSARMYY